jgi:hypothetical protein
MLALDRRERQVFCSGATTPGRRTTVVTTCLMTTCLMGDGQGIRVGPGNCVDVQVFAALLFGCTTCTQSANSAQVVVRLMNRERQLPRSRRRTRVMGRARSPRPVIGPIRCRPTLSGLCPAYSERRLSEIAANWSSHSADAPRRVARCGAVGKRAHCVRPGIHP